jgi:hypothetical protein
MDKPIGVAWVSSQPEFGDHKGVRAQFGLSRAHAYALVAEGKIRSVCLRRPGATRGRRLFDLNSIREFLNKHVEVRESTETKHAPELQLRKRGFKRSLIGSE